MTLFRSLVWMMFVVLLGVGHARAAGEEWRWLVGTWELAQDPDGSAKDQIEFTAQGEATSVSPEGRRVPGRYSVSGSAINIVYTFNGKEIPIQLTATVDRQRLLALSKKTGNTSEYRKLP